MHARAMETGTTSIAQTLAAFTQHSVITNVISTKLTVRVKHHRAIPLARATHLHCATQGSPPLRINKGSL